MNILNSGFKWTRPEHTNVMETWMRFGFVPVTQEEREARQKREKDDERLVAGPTTTRKTRTGA